MNYKQYMPRSCFSFSFFFGNRSCFSYNSTSVNNLIRTWAKERQQLLLGPKVILSPMSLPKLLDWQILESKFVETRVLTPCSICQIPPLVPSPSLLGPALPP
ncbi:hypothetical protein RJT34_23061 [Clitoria ternatea]|uniref:Uncharacterized protein n=1 Tax=Clitoria ternatea TaxID=43366 RepID=A0AAN9FKG7_CLITE